MHQNIEIRGARTHNLKDINLSIPRDQLVVITGISGSGKSSLAFDTLYAEGQRRYVESLSAYARQFLALMEKPDVDLIEGLSPAVSIEQKTTSHNPRSTVGTVTEIHDYLRLLFARVGTPHCPEHNIALRAQTVSEIVDSIMAQPEGSRWLLLAPLVRARKGEHLQLFENLRVNGFIRARVDGEIYELEDLPKLDKNKKHDIAAVVDRFAIKEELAQRLADSVEMALRLSSGLVQLAPYTEGEGSEVMFSARYSCPECDFSVPELEPKLFSFNSPEGACEHCDGMGNESFYDPELLVPDTSLSLQAGAIRGWEPHNPYLYHMVKAVMKHYKVGLKTPFCDIPQKARDTLLYGSKENINFYYESERGFTIDRKHPFEGIIPNLQRRYAETESPGVREDINRVIRNRPCSHCEGTRYNASSRNVRIEDVNLPTISAMPVHTAYKYFQELNLTGAKGEIAEKILKEIRDRLQFLVNVGLDYLSLDRTAGTLSGGEAQRIRLAKQIGSALVGVMYVLDEPSIGLHQRDNTRLLDTLKHLRDIGNSVLVVEHDEDAIRSADHVVDIGVGAGVHGGRVIAQGKVEDIVASAESITGQYLQGTRAIPVPERRTPAVDELWLKIVGARGNNLKNVDVDIPLGLFSCITGVSGSGKSTLINQTLLPLASHLLNGSNSRNSLEFEDIIGLSYLDKVIDIDQSPIGRTPRSNPATYTGMFSLIRDIFAGTVQARERGYKPGRFSFNVKGGRCEACQGDGLIKVEMHFLPDVYVLCDQCQGKRYNRETLEVKYKGKSIAEVLEMTVEQAYEFFEPIPQIARKVKTLLDCGLGYITLGQSATTLSGGEAQRVKLSRELSRRDTGSTLYILDEPTTGLHFHDIDQLLKVLHRLRDQGSTVIVIEHNLDVIKTCDWVIDLGPEGGNDGGQLVACGTPEQVAESPTSHTGHYLKPLL